MSISNIEGEKDIVIPPDEIYTLICQHSDVFKKYGKQWKKLIYNITYDEKQEDWKFVIDFKY